MNEWFDLWETFTRPENKTKKYTTTVNFSCGKVRKKTGRSVGLLATPLHTTPPAPGAVGRDLYGGPVAAAILFFLYSLTNSLIPIWLSTCVVGYQLP